MDEAGIGEITEDEEAASVEDDEDASVEEEEAREKFVSAEKLSVWEVLRGMSVEEVVSEEFEEEGSSL